MMTIEQGEAVRAMCEQLRQDGLPWLEGMLEDYIEEYGNLRTDAQLTELLQGCYHVMLWKADAAELHCLHERLRAHDGE